MRNNFSVFFITPDVKRGLGMENLLPDYHIIAANNDFVIPSLKKQGLNIFCLKTDAGINDIPQNSGQILENEKVLKYIRQKAQGKVYIAYFKPSIKLDHLIEKFAFNKIGNDFQLNEIFENKVRGIEIVRKSYPEYLLPFTIGKLVSYDFKKLEAQFNLPLVIQFGHGWAGKTTFFISGKKEFIKMQNLFPQTQVRINCYLPGFTVLNNAVIYKGKVFISPSALQINGLKELSHNEAVTCGRQWPVTKLTVESNKKIAKISRDVGELMVKAGYRGYFGLDFLLDEVSERVYLSDINARLTASTAFYSQLESGLKATPLLHLHYAEFLDITLDTASVLTDNHSAKGQIAGSQIIIRNKNTQKKLSFPPLGQYGYIEDEVILKSSKEYNLKKLSENDFIYLKNMNFSQADSELSRLETKIAALTSPHQISSWLANIIS